MHDRYINNCLAATAARVVEKEPDNSSSSESDDEDFRGHAGNMDLVRDTLSGLARKDTDAASIGSGRYDGCIQLGRTLWETPTLTQFGA